MSSICIRYFDIRGKAEGIRLFFEMAGIQYEEERFTGEEWFATGGKKQQYKEQNISQFGQVPIVSIGGDRHMSQTVAILRYFAKQHNVYGDNIDQQYTCDMVIDGVEDWRMGYVRIVYNPEYDSLIQNYVANNIPTTLNHFETLLSHKYKEHTDSVLNRVFFVNERWNLADVMVFDMLEHIVRLDSQVLTQYPLLHKFHTQFKEEPAIKKYLESGKRPEKVNNSGRG